MMDGKYFVSLLHGVKGAHPKWTAQCPAHGDRQASLSVTEAEDCILLRCHAGCTFADIVAILGLKPSDFFLGGREKMSTPRNNAATPQHPFTLHDYAAAKALPLEFLLDCGLTDITHAKQKAVRIPYLGAGGEALAMRFRIALKGDKFRWKSGTKPCLYGLNRLREETAVFLVEGESDAQTLWFHDFNAVGLPGAGQWRDDRDAPHLAGFENIYVLVEPDKGGRTLVAALAKSQLADRVMLVIMPDETPDASALHIHDAENFVAALDALCANATRLSDHLKAQAIQESSTAWRECAFLARQPDILAAFENALNDCGLVGETRTARLLYLAVTSRFLARPISVAVKGPSSGGKSFTTETVLSFFPEPAFYTLTAMSERAMAYSTEPLKHRMLVIYEASGMEGDMQTYLIRSLLSEGRIRYEMVDRTSEGFQPRLIEREGPTGLLVTTTALRLHPENETRLLSINVEDSREQTAAILRALASKQRSTTNLDQWRALQKWLATAEHRVDIPYASALADLVPPVATRLRRDFTAVLNLIKAHAILHQASRVRSDDGAIVADISDYAAIRELVVDLVSEGVGATVPDTVRETVDAVRRLLVKGAADVSGTTLAAALNLDKGNGSRRAANAVQRGYLVNNEEKRGKPARYAIGDPMPDQLEILPTPAEVLRCCGVAAGDEYPLHSDELDPFDLDSLENQQ